MALAELPEHDFHRATRLDEVCRLLHERSRLGLTTVLLAGGTDWIVEQHMAPAKAEGPRPLVVDISRVPDLRGIEIVHGPGGDVARIGAAATYLEIRRHQELVSRVPALDVMARDVGAIQIQARGTLGGNLATASPAADGVALLAALDADLVLRSPFGQRKVPLFAFYTGYKKTVMARDEVIARSDFRLPAAGAVTHWRKVGTRLAQAISKVALGAVAEIVDGRCRRIGLGMASVAPTTAFLPRARSLLLERPLAEVTDGALDEATLADISPIDDVRSTGDYRRHVATALVRRFVDGLR